MQHLSAGRRTFITHGPATCQPAYDLVDTEEVLYLVPCLFGMAIMGKNNGCILLFRGDNCSFFAKESIVMHLPGFPQIMSNYQPIIFTNEKDQNNYW